jgi:ribonuclease HI
VVIKDVEFYKYLGVYMDSELRWKTQLQKTVAKATAWILLFRRLTNVTTGISAKLMRRLYLSVALPKMTYGLNAWYIPPYQEVGKRRKTGSVGALKELSKIQRIATLAITGALRTTPTELLDAHAGVLPMDLCLRKICHRSLVRLATLHITNPASALPAKYHTNPATTHLTSVQHHLNIFKIDPNSLTATQPILEDPTPCQFLTRISDNPQQEEHDDQSALRVYTDGSLYRGQVGAAAILYQANEVMPVKSLRYLLGSAKHYSVNDAEIVAGILGCWLLQGSDVLTVEPISMYTDSQTFITESTSELPRTKDDLITMFSGMVDKLTGPNQAPVHGIRFTLRYIKAHRDVIGNETADKAAKAATTGDTSPTDTLPPLLRDGPLPRRAGAPKKTYMDELQAESAARWAISPRKITFDNIDSNYPFSGFRKIQDKLTRAKASLLMQLRTNHIPLNSYLSRFGAADSPRCATCWTRTQTNINETIRHFLFDCPTYNWERAEMDQALGRDSRNMKALLSSERHIAILLTYIGRTRRLRTKPGDVILLPIND